MAITFGSFGDIIAAVQVAYKLLQILSSQQGAKREFRDLVVDLRLFHRFLDQLLLSWQTRESCPRLDDLFDLLHPVICDAKGEITACLEKIISKYGKSLTSLSKRNPKDIGNMLLWGMLERDGVNRLQDKLRKSKEMIMMVQVQVIAIEEEKNRALVDEKISTLMLAEEEAMNKLNKRLNDLEDSFKGQLEIMNRICAGVGSLSSAIIPIASATLDLPSMLMKIYTELLAQRVDLRGLNPHAQNSALVEDALGWTIQIPLDVVVSWQTLHSILSDKFMARPGWQLVKGRRYVLRDELSSMDIVRNMPLASILRPGQKINMSMVYFAAEQQTMVCPKCKATTLRATDTDFTCLNEKCRMEIQRIEEVVEEDALRISAKTVSIDDEDYDDDNDNHNHHDFDQIASTRLVRPQEIEEGPGIFKRIRFISRWEHRAESRGRLFYKGEQFSIWRSRGLEGRAMAHALTEFLSKNLPESIVRKVEQSFDDAIGIRVIFIGTSVQQSRPIIRVFAKKKKNRDAVWKFSKDIEWIKNNPFLTLVTARGSPFESSSHAHWNRKFL